MTFPDLQAPFAAGGYPAAARALVEAFPARGDDRLFLNCWIPQALLQTAIERRMAAHGDPQRWWDGLEIDAYHPDLLQRSQSQW